MQQTALDEIDLKIISSLAKDSRTSYRSLGQSIGLTTKSVKARVDKMLSNGVIQRFFVKVNPAVFGYGKMCLLVVRQSDVTKDTIDRLNLLGDLLFQAHHLGGTTVFGLAVKEEAEDRIELLIDALKPALVQSIIVGNSYVKKELTQTDYEIIRCLMSDPRMEISDIAKEISASAKTVSRRLENMRENKVLEFSLLPNAAALGGYIMFTMAINVERSSYRSVLEKVNAELQEYFLMPSAIINQEDMIVLRLLCKNMFIIDSILRRVESYPGVNRAEIFLPTETVCHPEWILREINRKLGTVQRALVRPVATPMEAD